MGPVVGGAVPGVDADGEVLGVPGEGDTPGVEGVVGLGEGDPPGVVGPTGGSPMVVVVDAQSLAAPVLGHDAGGVAFCGLAGTYAMLIAAPLSVTIVIA